MANDIKKIHRLIEIGRELEPGGGSLASGYNGEGQSDFLAWRTQVLQTLEGLTPPMTRNIKEIEDYKDGRYYYQSSVRYILGILQGIAAFLEDTEKSTPISPSSSNSQDFDQNKAFIVHGHDDALLHNIARYMGAMDIDSIILQEKVGSGMTIIEKLEKYSDVKVAIVLLTPDDIGKAKNEDKYSQRARQNVIMELGYFIGKLGRSNVFALYDEDVELPSDYIGVEYIALDDSEGWKLKLAKELKATGLDIDLNKIC